MNKAFKCKRELGADEVSRSIAQVPEIAHAQNINIKKKLQK